MQRILKSKPLPHVIICDTSILWNEDKTPVASPDFEAFWAKNTPIFDLSLYIPEIVRGELLFQHFSSCHKLLKTTEDHFKKISSITAREHKTRLTSEKARTHIEEKFEKWIKTHRATILQIPIEKIDWARIANDSVWRMPPFIPDPKNPDIEKGFRDALIMETVVDFVLSDTRKINIAFLCGDSVLRIATLDRLKGNTRFAAYETIEDFESYLALTKQKLTNEFINRIMARAREHFFLAGDRTCLYIREGLRDKIRTEFKQYFDDPFKSEKGNIQWLDFGASKSTWIAKGEGSFWILSPEFVKIESEKIYFWKSFVRFLRLYKPSSEQSLPISAPTEQARVLTLLFQITWSAMVKKDARFYDLQIVNIELVNNEFRVPTQDEIKRYDLDIA